MSIATFHKYLVGVTVDLTDANINRLVAFLEDLAKEQEPEARRFGAAVFHKTGSFEVDDFNPIDIKEGVS